MGTAITKLIGITLLVVALIFLGPFFCLIGWNCVRELWPTLPSCSYWQMFWISNAITYLARPIVNVKRQSD